MQNPARYKAVFELLEQIFADKLPADNLINDYMRQRKYIGSKDRRFITEKVWDILRHRRRLEFDAGSDDVRKLMIVALKDDDLDLIFTGDDYALAPLSKQEKSWLRTLKDNSYPLDVEAECPKWLFDKIENLDLLKSLNQPATADFRINVDSRENLIRSLQKEGLFFAPTPYSPIGLRSTERVNLNNCSAYHDGDFDIQDEASQLAVLLAQPQPNLKIIDYCAGAGGKSLTMAYLMKNQGRIFVYDINPHRLEALKSRAARLNARTFDFLSSLVDTDFDLFVVDAPCSGSGTWRRSPDAKFRLTPETLSQLSQTQTQILETAYTHTKKGGKIAYFTCSILKDENDDVINAFLSRHDDVKLIDLSKIWQQIIQTPYPFSNPFLAHFSPLVTSTDGFFVALLQKI